MAGTIVIDRSKEPPIVRLVSEEEMRAIESAEASEETKQKDKDGE